MRILIAPDSFKGTLTAREVCDIIGEAFKEVIPDCEITKLPAADGGEGLCACLHDILGGERLCAEVCGVFPDSRITAEYVILPDKTAVVEMAACAGLPLAGERKNPLKTTTYGVGELLLDAKKNGAKKILLGLGGSATNDCGAGMAAALGWKFLDENAKEFIPVGESLINIRKIEKTETDYSLPVTAACDVTNPLFGKNGAAFVFAPQKGADAEAVDLLDRGLQNIADVIYRDLGLSVAEKAGAGAAGGMGAGVHAFLSASLKSGANILLDAANFEKKCQNADLVVTGEGRLDSQSADGKVISCVALRAEKLGKRVIAVCGSKGDGAEKISGCGIEKAYFAVNVDKSFAEILASCRCDLYTAAEKAAKDYKT